MARKLLIVTGENVVVEVSKYGTLTIDGKDIKDVIVDGLGGKQDLKFNAVVSIEIEEMSVTPLVAELLDADEEETCGCDCENCGACEDDMPTGIIFGVGRIEADEDDEDPKEEKAKEVN